jgi:protein-S-isoprenylcysteine O-methyltransferase Ste14
MFGRTSSFAYGVTCYAIFLASFLYAIGFIGNFLVPTTLDGTPTGSTAQALLINLGLLSLFAVQHSVMARPAFKRAWTKLVPVQVERSTYVLFSSLALILMFWLWRPLGGTIWDVSAPAGRAALYSVYALGWGILLLATFLINHFDLFGLRQVWLHLRGREYTQLRFQTPMLYRFVRHPLYVGWLLIFWATPTMTTAHLVFAIMTTAYILIAIQLEERDLIDVHGYTYRSYRDRVPMLIPSLRRERRAQPVPSREVA